MYIFMLLSLLSPQKTTSGSLPQYNTAQMKPESTQPAVMQPIAEPPPAYSPTAAQPLISAELQKKEEVATIYNFAYVVFLYFI